MLGGFSSEQPMDMEVTNMVMTLRPQIQAKLMCTYNIFVPVSFRSQLVAGMRYQVRIAVDDGKNIFVLIDQALPCAGGECTVTEAQLA